MPDSLQVAVIEDDPTVRLGCEQALQLEGIPTLGFDSAETARTAIGVGFPGVVLSAIRLPGKDGMTLLRELRALNPDLPVVLITGHGEVVLQKCWCNRF